MTTQPGQIVYTSDGQVFGQIAHIILDGGSDEPCGLVLRRSPTSQPAIIVPATAIEQRPNGGLQLTALHQPETDWPHFDEHQYSVPPEGFVLPHGYVAGTVLVPTSGYVPEPAPATPGGRMAAPALPAQAARRQP